MRGFRFGFIGFFLKWRVGRGGVAGHVGWRLQGGVGREQAKAVVVTSPDDFTAFVHEPDGG